MFSSINLIEKERALLHGPAHPGIWSWKGRMGHPRGPEFCHCPSIQVWGPVNSGWTPKAKFLPKPSHLDSSVWAASVSSSFTVLNDNWRIHQESHSSWKHSWCFVCQHYWESHAHGREVRAAGPQGRCSGLPETFCPVAFHARTTSFHGNNLISSNPRAFDGKLFKLTEQHVMSRRSQM